MSWPIKKLAEVAKIEGGGTPSTKNPLFWNGDIPWLTPRELSDFDDAEIYDTERKITSKGLEKSSTKLFPIGTVLLTSRAPIGYIAIAGTQMATNQGFKNFICDPKILNNKFLYYFFKLKTKYLQSLGRGATFTEISRSILEKVEISLPPLEVQKHIVERLDEITEAQKLSDSLIQKAEELFQSLLYKELNSVDKNWTVNNLGDLSELVTKGTTPTTYGHQFTDSGTPFLRAEDINNQPVDHQSVQYHISEETNNFLSRSKTKADDILITIAGTIGRIGFVPRNAPVMNMNQAVAIVRLKKSIDFKYVYFLLQDKGLQKKIFGAQVTGTITNLSLTNIRNLKIPFPPLNIQKQIVTKLSIIQDYKKHLLEQKLQLSELFDSVLYKALNGELALSPATVKVSRSREQWFAIKQGVGAVLEKLAQTAYERGEMVVAKYMFFLQEIYKIPFGLRFVQHQFGPYDPDIKKAIAASAFNKDKYFMVKGSGEKQVYSLGNNSSKLFGYSSNILQKSRNSLDELIQYTATAKSSDIERLASVCKLIQDYQTVDEQTIQTKMAEWKPGKFTSAQIKKSLDFVVAKQWNNQLLN